MCRMNPGIWILGLLGAALLCLSAAPVQAEVQEDHYIIGKGDILEIVVWQEPELSRQVKVRVDGRISMPLVDDVQAAGLTPLELKEVVTENLAEFIEAPEATVIVQNQVSKSYYVLGEVRGQGEFELDKELTLLQALARAQGFTEWADKRNLLLLRQGKDGQERFEINYRNIISGDAPEQNLLIKPGDTLVVPY